MDKKEFKNEDRSRYYGIRVGDRVSFSAFGTNKIEGEVMQYGFMDNNRVYVLFDGDKEVQGVVAEWLTIIKKVEEATEAIRFFIEGKHYKCVRSVNKFFLFRKGSVYYCDCAGCLILNDKVVSVPDFLIDNFYEL